MLISLPPVITKGEAKTTLFPWYVYPPVEPFVARMLAGTVGRTATFFLSLTSPCRSLCLYPTLLADNPTMPLVCNPSYLSSAQFKEPLFLKNFQGLK